MIEVKLQAAAMPEDPKAALADVVREFSGAFLTKGDLILPLVDHFHAIETTGPPFKEVPFRVSQIQREILEQEIESMKKVGVIRA